LSVKPLEQIKDMKIISVEGLNRAHGPSSGVSPVNMTKSLPESLVDSALQHRVAAPLTDELMRDAGLTGGINALSKLDD
jgi:hypothetical protein